MKKLLAGILIFSLLIGCNNHSENSTQNASIQEEPFSKEDLLKKIKTLEEQLYQTKDKYDTKLALKVLEAYKEYLKAYPNDSLAASYTFKAGEIAMSLNKSQEAIAFFKRISETYTNFDKSSYALFLTAFIYDSQLRDYTQARIHYEAFIQKYPDHELINDAKASLENLGKTPEQLIEEFKKKKQS